MIGFPTHPDAIQCDWLAATLGQPVGSLRGISHRAVGTGQMCDSYRLTLDWTANAASAPTTIIAKCPSHDPASRAIAQQLGNYLLEVNWYRHLAHTMPVAAPHCYFADIADDTVDFLLLLADLAPARQGDQLTGVDLPALELAVDQAAALHAPWWNAPQLGTTEWLQKDTRPIVRALFPSLFAGFRERYADRLHPDHLALGADLVTHLDAYLERQPSARSLTHGDFRVDNILFDTDAGQAWIVDWQTLGTGSGAADVAYLVGTSIADPDVRGAADHPLFDRWIAALAQRGVTTDPAALWDDYRVGALTGMFMAVFASMSVERTARGDEMFAVMAERPARQALALDSLALL